MGEDALFLHPCSGVAFLLHSAVLQNHNLVSDGDGTHPVGDNQHGFVFNQTGNGGFTAAIVGKAHMVENNVTVFVSEFFFAALYRAVQDFVHSRNVAVGGNAEGCHVGTHESGDVNQDRQGGKKFFLAIIIAIKSAGGHARRIKNLVFCFT